MPSGARNTGAFRCSWVRPGAPIFFFFFQAEDGILASSVTGVQTCALPISPQFPIGSQNVHGSDGPSAADAANGVEIGRASCRERGKISVVAGAINTKI